MILWPGDTAPALRRRLPPLGSNESPPGFWELLVSQAVQISQSLDRLRETQLIPDLRVHVASLDIRFLRFGVLASHEVHLSQTLQGLRVAELGPDLRVDVSSAEVRFLGCGILLLNAVHVSESLDGLHEAELGPDLGV